ncbi:MAG: hypothetical protein K6F80_02985 [Oscillospiraceae bacterium]|nr:hypothetical protein [Oscillospiraceae bacterium]
MKVFLIVLLILVLLITIVCVSQIVACLSFREGKFSWEVRYFGIHILPRPKSDKPKPPKKDKKKKDEPPKNEKPLRKKLLMDKLWEMLQNVAEKCDLVGSGIAALPGPLQKLLRSVTWSDIETDIVIGGEDAAQTAKQFGIVQVGLNTLVSASAHMIHVKRKQIRIGCDFTADTSKWDFSCKVRVRIGTVLGAGIWLLWKFLKDRNEAGKQLVSDVL